MAELDQATGALSQIVMAGEQVYGVIADEPNFRPLRVIGGETLDENRAVFGSRQIRSDRMSNRKVRGTMRPGGGLPFELSPKGWLPFFWYLLGGAVTTTGTGPLYTHVIKGSVDLTSGADGAPCSFTLEKGFTDIEQYYQFLGCRVAGMSLDFEIDQIPTGSWDILAREFVATDTSFADGESLVLPTQDPFTSVQIDLYEGNSLDLLATCERLNLSVSNGFYEDRGFILGDNKRQSLKPGTRVTTASGRFIFNSGALYAKAVSGVATKLRIKCDDGTNSIQFDMPNFQFEPNGSTPKIADDGPVSIEVGGSAQKDSGENTDIKCTMVVPEATIAD